MLLHICQAYFSGIMARKLPINERLPLPSKSHWGSKVQPLYHPLIVTALGQKHWSLARGTVTDCGARPHSFTERSPCRGEHLPGTLLLFDISCLGAFFIRRFDLHFKESLSFLCFKVGALLKWVKCHFCKRQTLVPSDVFHYNIQIIYAMFATMIIYLVYTFSQYCTQNLL